MAGPLKTRSPLMIVALCLTSIATFAATTAPPAVSVQGNRIVDASGATLQLRGANLGGTGLTSVQGWAWMGGSTGTYDNWGLQKPRWNAMQSWGINSIRIGLNEASWLGLHTFDPVANNSGGADGHQAAAAGNLRRADPGGNYRQQIIDAVKEATDHGLYVILELHENGPDISPDCALKAAAATTEKFECRADMLGKPKVAMTPFVPNYTQNPLPDADHSIEFWTSVAKTFKSRPNVIFDLFNEPFIRPWFTPSVNQWEAWLKGTTVPFYYTGGKPAAIYENWQSVGMQTLVDTVRATGASNIVMIGGLGYAGDMEGWLEYMPKDPLRQLVAAWHAYPASNVIGDAKARQPGWGDKEFDYVATIAKTVPVIIGETGDRSANGTVGSPFVQRLLPWADTLGISYLGWAWAVWGSEFNDLIKDQDGTPTDGYGAYYRQHLLCMQKRAPGAPPCP